LPVVFLLHGILGSADDWIVHSKEDAPAFRLADKGYDVWLGNNRGNKYSLKHNSLDYMKHEDYWRFSFEEMGDHDARAMVNNIKKLT
jgi:lysosomal acid lipase/cholesteryl ester hydrolase